MKRMSSQTSRKNSNESSNSSFSEPRQQSLPFSGVQAVPPVPKILNTSNSQQLPQQPSSAKVTLVNVSKLNAASFNAPSRTSNISIAALLEEIKQHGVLNPIHILHHPPKHFGLIIDGHRRVACAQALGITHIPAIVSTEGEPAAIWATLNKGTRKTTSYEWLYAYIHSGAKAVPQKAILANIREVESIFGGKAGLQFLLDQNVSPQIVKQINMVHKLVRSYPSLACPTKEKIGRWMINHNMGNVAVAAIRACEFQKSRRSEYAAARRIVNAIELDKNVSVF